MQRSPETDGNQYQMISIDGTQTFELKAASVETESGNANDKTTDAEKTAGFRPVEMGYDKGVGKIIANGNKDLPNGEEVPEGACLVPEVGYTSLEMQQQIGLLRRLMCPMAVLLLVVFLTVVASLVLAVAPTIAKTLSSNQANSSQGSESTVCGESLSFPDLKLKITELEKALTLTGSYVKELRTELKMQMAVIANLTTQGGCPKPKNQTNDTFRPTSCLDYLSRGACKCGMYQLYDNAGNSYPAYCDMKSEPGTVWTLVMSWANVHRALPSFRNVPLKGNAPVNENAQNWNLYRLSLARMRSLQAHSTHWRATCSYPTYGVDFRDYVRGNFRDFNVVDFSASGQCMKVEFVNIRGHMGMHLSARVWQSTSFFWHISDSGCQFDPTADSVSSEDNFGYYFTINPKFRCNEGPLSTTQWWFGAHL